MHACILWIIPFWWYDLGVNLLTDAFFTIFTIMFLTLIIKSRENSHWKLVEKEVMRRTARRLGQILFEIESNFLSGFQIPEIKEEILLAEMNRNAPTMPQVISKRDDSIPKQAATLLIEYYAKKDATTLGSNWEKLHQLPYKDAEKIITTQIYHFTRHREHLEHVINEYAKFFHPKLIHSIMEIQNGLDSLISALALTSRGIRLSLSHRKESLALAQAHALLTNSIHMIIKELKEINQHVAIQMEVFGFSLFD